MSQLNWIEVNQELPTTEGKYVVKTISAYGTYFHSKHIIEVKFNFNIKGQPVWGCSNQKVTHWLKEQNEKI